MAFCKKIKRYLLSISLQAKIIGMVVGLTLFMGTVLSLQVSRYLNDHTVAFMEQESKSMANELAYKIPDYILINDLYGLTRFLNSTRKNRRDIRYMIVIDSQGNILAHTFGSKFPVELRNHLRHVSQRQNEVQVLRTNEGLIWETVLPVLQGWQGSVAVGVTDTFVRRENQDFIHGLLLTVFFVGVTGILCAMVLSWLIARPVKELLHATHAIRSGKYPVLDPVSRDEVGALTRAFNDMSNAFQVANEARREKETISRNFLQKIITSQENERKRIARELHDQTGQSLASLSIGLNLLERSAGSEEMRQRIHQLKENIEQELDAIHNLALELRPSILDDIGLVAALTMLVQNFIKINKVDIQQNIVGFQNRRPDTAIETCLYRIIQEAIHNAIRHGRARHISLFLEWAETTIRLVIDDDGTGFDPHILKQTDRLGIRGIQERVELAGGTFRLESEPGQGTMIVVTVPAETGEEHA